MVNRLKEYFREPEERGPEESYWEIHGEFSIYFVHAATAQAVLDRLTALWPPRWVHFRDVHGSFVCVRSRDVEQVVESTTEQRASEREFRRARRREEKADRRPWEDDD